MKFKLICIAALLVCPRLYAQANPYRNAVFPSVTMTGDGTSVPINLNSLTPLGGAFNSATIEVNGANLTTATFAVMVSNNNGATYYPASINAINATSTTATSITVSTDGLYQIPLAGITNVEFVVSGTFTATSLTFTLTATPNGLISKVGGSSFPYPGIPYFTSATAGAPATSAQFGTADPELRSTVGLPLATGDLWYQSLNNCQNQPLNVFYYTDSRGVVYQGDGSNEGPTTATNRYAEQLRLYLQGRCGSHGTGLVPFNKFYYPGSPNPNNQYYSVTGTWTYDNTIGPVQTSPGTCASGCGAVVSASSGAVITFTTSATGIAYNSLNSYCVEGPSYGTWSISIDSGAETGTCGGTNTSEIAQLVTIAAGSSLATHSVTYTCGTGPCKFYGAEGVNGTTGVSVSSMGEASGVAEMMTSPTAFAFADLIPGGPNLVITDYGTNEPVLGFSTTSYQSALATIITHEQAQASKPAVLITAPPVSGGTDASQMPAYAAAALATAVANNVGYVSTIDQWGTAFISSLFDSDLVHPNDKGTLSEFALQKASVIDNEEVPPSASLGANTFTGSQTAPQFVPTTTANASSAGVVFTAPGVNAFQWEAWSTGFNFGLGSVLSLYDGTTSKHLLAFNSSDDLYGYVPNTNVAAGTGAAWSILHTGAASYTEATISNATSNSLALNDINTNVNPGNSFGVHFPNIAAGNYGYWGIGNAPSTDNEFDFAYHHAGAGSASNALSLNAYGNVVNNVYLEAGNLNGVNMSAPAYAWDVHGAIHSDTSVITPIVIPGTLYAASGTPLPACAAATQGETAIVTDATSPTYMGAYTSGGAITASVICSYNGTTYSWLMH